MATSPWKQPYHLGRRFLTSFWLSLHKRVQVIGVTGSYGKTSTTQAISRVLSQASPTLQTDLNLDTVYNLPFTILKLRSSHRFLVLELGVDHVGEMDSYLKLVKPLIGVVTGITPVHSEQALLGSLEGIICEKGKLLESLPERGWAILNFDNQYVRAMAKKTQAQRLTYGIKGEHRGLDFFAKNIKLGFEGTSFEIYSRHLDWNGEKVQMKLVGKHFVGAALAAVAVGFVCKVSKDKIKAGLEELQPLKGRLSVEEGPLGTLLLDDHLRANPASTIAGLETLSLLPSEERKIAVLGEMGELGIYAEEEHRKVGQFVAGLKLDFLVSVGPLQKFVAEEAVKGGMKQRNVHWVPDVEEAAEVLKPLLKRGDLIYLKGSLLRHMERILLILNGQQVDCSLVSCHRYGQCPSCPVLRKSL